MLVLLVVVVVVVAAAAVIVWDTTRGGWPGMNLGGLTPSRSVDGRENPTATRVRSAIATATYSNAYSN